MKSISATNRALAAGLLMIAVAVSNATAADPVPPSNAPVELLWPAGAPLAKGMEPIDQPSLTLFPAPADKANGTAVVICPGGGYSHLATNHEGVQVAEWLNSIGVSAYMLKYRLAPKYSYPAQLLDVQRAIRTVRARATEWKLDPHRIGILGFSAGGHLASTAITHFDAGQADAADAIDKVSSRPDFAVLCYPVISLLPPFAHTGSRKNLLGANPDPKLVETFSNDLQVTPQTPPTFLFHTNEDTGVPPENSVQFYLALRKHKVPAEMHIYEQGKHGLGMGKPGQTLNTWPLLCANWLRARGLLEPAK